jgi:transposase InsO family protein
VPIRALHEGSRRAYGSPQVLEDLIEQGEAVSRKRVAWLMRDEGLVARVRKRFRSTTMSDHDQAIAANVFDRRFAAARPNQRWLGDTTEFVIGSHAKVYLAAILDLHSRFVVGWALSAVNDRHLTLSALDKALKRRCPDAGLLHHSDHGCTYASEDYRARLARHGITCSMSRRGNCTIVRMMVSLRRLCIHVLCALGNSTPTGTPVLLDGIGEAELFAFQPLQPTGNVWDFALAEFSDPDHAEGQFTACADGSVNPYPSRLTPASEVQPGANHVYTKVGAKSPTCRSGHLTGVGDVLVKYGDGNRWFTGQLILSAMTSPGDSGSLLVHQASQTATGLVFAGDEGVRTIANPLFKIGWRSIGELRVTAGGASIPLFDAACVTVFECSQLSVRDVNRRVQTVLGQLASWFRS